MRRQKKWAIPVLLCILSAFILSVCKRNSLTSDNSDASASSPSYNSAIPSGLSFPIEDLLDPRYFDQDAAVFQTFFPRPVSATFVHDGIQEDVSAEDSRLNRLMNLIEYSWKNGKTVWLQGIVPEEELEEWMRKDLPILIISFSADDVPEGMDPVNQIMICGAECLIEYPDQNGVRMIEKHWPCAQYLQDMEASRSISEDEYLFYLDHAKESPWFDILMYTGFQSGKN